MESTGTYQAGDTADESATPEKVVSLRPYTKKDNAYADRLIGVVSPSAYYLLDYLIRQTVGFHRDSVRYSSRQLATVTHLSQRTIFTAIRELETLRVLAKDAGDMGRTQIRTFRLLASDEWQLPERDSQTTAKFAVVEKKKRTTAKTTVDEQVTTANFAEDATQTTANFADLIKKEEYKENREKENASDASASADAPKASTPKKPRKERRPPTPEEEYRAQLIADVSGARGYKHRNHGMEWKAAGEFWRWPDGPVPVADVAEFTRLEIRRPKWAGNPLTLPIIFDQYQVYQRGKPGYVKALERACAAANGEYDKPRQNGRAASTTLPSTIRQLSD